MIFDKGLKDKWFILPIIFLSASLLIRIYWTFINLRSYPFESMPDAGNHIITLFFLAKYGFHQIVPNIWNGIVLFDRIYPGLYYYSLPLYYLTNNAVSAIFLSLIQSLGLGFIFIFFLGRFMKISFVKRVAFFLFVFASPIIMDYMQIGRYAELTGWVLFIPFFTCIMWYKNHRINKKFLIFVILYSVIILTHHFVMFVSSIFIIPLFLVKKLKERVIIGLSVILAFILTSFWWIKAFPFMFRLGTYLKGSSELVQAGSIISYNTIIISGFLILFYIYYKSCENKKEELLFYSPLLILSLLILTRLIVLIPILNMGFIMPYNMFFLFMCIYLFFNINFRIIPQLKRMIPVFLIILTISMFIFSFLRVDYSISRSPVREEFLSILPEVEGRYIFVTKTMMNPYLFPHYFPKQYDDNVMDYAIIHYNLSTPFGTTILTGARAPEYMQETTKRLYGCGDAWAECKKEDIIPPDCNTIKDISTEQNVRSLLASDEDCDFLKECGYKEKLRKRRACLFII